MFTTNRLLVRAYQDSDYSSFQRMYNDASIQQTTNPFLNQPFPDSAVDVEIKKLHETTMFLGILALKSDPNQLLGCVYLRGDPGGRSAMLGITMLPDGQGKGYGTEATRFMVDWAFRMGGLHRVWLSVFEGNDRAVRVYKKA